MKVRVGRDLLAEAAVWAARSLPNRPALPSLAGLRLVATDESLTLTAFDHAVFAEVRMAAELSDEGATCVPGRLLAEIAKALPQRPVELVAEGTRTTVTCGSAQFTLPVYDTVDLPEPPVVPAPTGSLDSGVLATAVAQVGIAAGRDDMLPALSGIRIEYDADRVILAATDRYRLAVRELSWTPQSPSAAGHVLVPARWLTDVTKSLGGPTADLSLPGDDGRTALAGLLNGSRRSATRVIDSEFPKYQALFPPEAAVVATVDTAGLMEAVKRVALVAERTTPVQLLFADGEVALRVGGGAAGQTAEASESLAANLDGEDIAIGFNPGYLLDGLAAVGSTTARLSFTVPTRPAVLQGVSAEGDIDSAYRYLLMPIRLSSG